MRRPGVSLLALALVYLVSATLAGTAQGRWFETRGAVTGFDPAVYLTGFATSDIAGNTQEGEEGAKRAALADLASKLRTSIASTSRITTSEVGKENFSSYQSDVSATVNLDLSGVERYERYFDPRAKRFAALCVLNKEQMRIFLAERRTVLVSRLDGQLQEARDYLAKKRSDLLAKTLEGMELTLCDLAQNVSIDTVLGGQGASTETLKGYYRSQDDLRSQVRTREILTEGDLLADLVAGFDWKGFGGARVAVFPALYKTTEITGEFFYYLKGRIEDSLALGPDRMEIAAPDAAGLRLILKGSYFETKDGGWRLVYKLNDVANRVLLGSYEVDLGPRFVSGQKLAFVPPNISIAASDHDRLVAGYAQSTTTDFRAWTNKGREGVVFRAGDTVQFYVQTNKPGYVSLLYHLAGAERIRTPLFQNYRIDVSQLMIPVKVEIEFEATPPFGSETAQFFFSTEPLSPFPTKSVVIEGQPYEVLVEDFGQFLSRTRGIGVKAPAAGSPVQKVEASVTITTIAGGV